MSLIIILLGGSPDMMIFPIIYFFFKFYFKFFFVLANTNTSKSIDSGGNLLQTKLCKKIMRPKTQTSVRLFFFLLGNVLILSADDDHKVKISG